MSPSFCRNLSMAIAGLLLLACPASPPARAESPMDGPWTAALPLDYPLGPSGLPVVLSGRDASLYRDIFALQEKGEWRQADERIERLGDRLLMGHVRFQRYMHPTAYRSRYDELEAWLAAYADHPEAERIHRLALRRKPAAAAAPQRPKPVTPAAGAATAAKAKPYRSSRWRSSNDGERAIEIKQQIRADLLANRLSAAEERRRGADVGQHLDRVEIDECFAQIAAGWYYLGDANRAYRLAVGVAERAGAQVPMAHWTAGLAAWRLGRLEAAAFHFERLASSRRVSGWNAAAGAYWAARVHLRLRAPGEMSRWLELGARHQRTFYGLLARRALGMDLGFEFREHRLTTRRVDQLLALPEARRAMALLQAGQRRRAEAELLRLGSGAEPAVAKSLLALAEQARLPGLSLRLARRLANGGGRWSLASLDAALYPIPPWQPKDGFAVDRALVYALMRRESGFRPEAESPDGARGLMQLMPGTADYVAGKQFRGDERQRLFEPEYNMELGQRYIAHLLEHSRVGGDLLRLAVAYNGGPGNLSKWQQQVDDNNDPLLFIESLPARETRLFIERVLTNFWIYRERLGQASPSLDAIAAGRWPGYDEHDGRTREVAHHVED